MMWRTFQSRPASVDFIVPDQLSAVDPLLVNLYTARSVATLALFQGLLGKAQDTGFISSYA